MKRLLGYSVCMILLGLPTAAFEESLIVHEGREVVLRPDGTWLPKERYERIEEFKSKIDIKLVRVNPKRNRFRTITMDITNNSGEILQYAAIGVKFKFGEEYSLRKIISVNNLAPGDTIEVQRQVSVQDIEGRDILIEVIDFTF